MRKISLTLGLLVAGLGFATAGAQTEPPPADGSLNPSSIMLLNRGHSGNIAIDSGRYTVRPKPETRPTPPPIKKNPKESAKDPADENRDPVTVVVPNTQEAEPPANVSVPPAQQIIVKCEEAASAVGNPVPPTKPVLPPPVDSGRRLNIIDLSFAPGFLYNNSDSSYSFRTYTSAAPTLMVESNVWLNPTFALMGSYTSTLSGHVNDSANGSRNVSATQEWFQVGIRTRKFFGADSIAPVLIFGINYLDYQFRVPADAVSHEGLHSSGLQLSLEAEVPANRTRTWIWGVSLAPKLKHSESATSIDFHSGGSVDANAVGLSVGSRIQLERNDSVFWKLSHTVEKDLFSGTANVADPVTGSAPTGVAVINSFTTVQIGYSWGN